MAVVCRKMWEGFCVAYLANVIAKDTLNDRLRDNLRDDKIGNANDEHSGNAYHEMMIF